MRLSTNLALAMLCVSLVCSSAFAYFPDLSPYEQDYPAPINWMLHNGVAEGYSDGTFHPDSEVTRVEFLKMLYASAGGIQPVTKSTVEPLPFTDLPAEPTWYTPYVYQAYQDGVIAGYPDGTFHPEATINFAEAAKMTYEVFFDQPIAEFSAKFRGACKLDASYYMNTWFHDYINVIDAGCAFPDSVLRESGAYHPALTVDRLEAAFVIVATKFISDSGYVPGDGFLAYDSRDYAPLDLVPTNHFNYEQALAGLDLKDWLQVGDSEFSEEGEARLKDAILNFVPKSGTAIPIGIYAATKDTDGTVCARVDVPSQRLLPHFIYDFKRPHVCFAPGESPLPEIENANQSLNGTVYLDAYSYDYAAYSIKGVSFGTATKFEATSPTTAELEASIDIEDTIEALDIAQGYINYYRDKFDKPEWAGAVAGPATGLYSFDGILTAYNVKVSTPKNPNAGSITLGAHDTMAAIISLSTEGPSYQETLEQAYEEEYGEPMGQEGNNVIYHFCNVGSWSAQIELPNGELRSVFTDVSADQPACSAIDIIPNLKSNYSADAITGLKAERAARIMEYKSLSAG